MPIIESVAIMAIFISIKLNFRKIYLTGVEHDWLKTFKLTSIMNHILSLCIMTM